MTELKRWLERDDIDAEIIELLRAAPRPRAMSAGERARSARTLGRIAALPVAAGVMFWIKNVALAGILGAASGVAVSGAVIVASRAPDPAQKTFQAAIAAPSKLPERAPAPAARQSEPEAPTNRSASSPKFVIPTARLAASSAPDIDSLASEAQKLEQARSALTRNPGRALELLGEHARQFPKGKLSAERELLAIDALRRLGRASEARTRTQAMLERSKGGLYEERLRRMLQSLP